MLHRLVVPVVVLAAGLGLASCSSGSPTTPGAASTAPTSASASDSPPSPAPSTPSSGATVAGGGATDFCGAYQEWKDAVQADTPQAQGAGFRAAAADIRTYAPAEIKNAADLYADVMDEVGQKIAAGGENPGTLGSGQSEDRRQALADSVAWIQSHCKS